MSIHNEDKDRKIVPRWRPLLRTINAGELRPLRIRPQTETPDTTILELRKSEWEEFRSIPHAGDLISVAVATKQDTIATEAAQHVLDHKNDAPNGLVAIAERVIHGRSTTSEIISSDDLKRYEDHTHSRIHHIRQRLHDEPRNSFLWIEIARHYSNIGLPEQATRTIEIALQLQPQNRFVLRSASRHFVHIDDYRRAHNTLQNCTAVRADPWLMAAEIAAASTAGRTSRNAKRAKTLIADEQYDPFHLSELSSALSTLELEAGRTHHARKYIQCSLTNPTENTIAQTAWLLRRYQDIAVKEFEKHASSSHEALAWDNCLKSNWHDCISEASAWLDDQPFSSRPAELASYVAVSALGDFDIGISIAKRGLLANPKNFTLLNNLSFSLAQANRTTEALGVFSMVNQSQLTELNKITWMATKGLIEFRSGRPSTGRLLYEKAIEQASAHDNYAHLTIASLWLTLEEYRIGGEQVPSMKRRASDLMAKHYCMGIDFLREKVTQGP